MKHLLIIAFILSTSCTTQKDKEPMELTQIDCDGLTFEEVFSAIVVLKNGIILLGGQDDFLSNNAIIYLSADGGKNWTECYKGDGDILKICYKKEVTMAVKTPNFNDTLSKYELLQSLDYGKQWSSIDFPAKKIYNLILVNDSISAIFGLSPSGKHRIYSSFDNCSNWSEFDHLDTKASVRYSSAIATNGTLYCLYHTSLNMKEQRLFSYNYITDTFDSFDVPDQLVNPEIEVLRNGDLTLVEKQESDLIIYKLSNKNFELKSTYDLHSFNSLVDYIEFNKNLVAIEVSQSGHFNNYTINYSDDKGENWKVLENFEAVSLNPYAIHDNLIYSYAGKGKLNVIKVN